VGNYNLGRSLGATDQSEGKAEQTAAALAAFLLGPSPGVDPVEDRLHVRARSLAALAQATTAPRSSGLASILTVSD